MAKRKTSKKAKNYNKDHYRSDKSYMSNDPVKHARSMANLTPGKGKHRKIKNKATDKRFKLSSNHIQFIEQQFYIPETRRPIVLLDFEKQILDRLFRKAIRPNLAVIGMPKKAGKSTLSAAIALFYLITKTMAEIYLLASDVQQTSLVCFSKLAKSIRMNDRLRKECKISVAKGRIEYEDSFVQILAPNSSLAGINPSLVIAEELWSWVTTEHRRAWDELVNVPTREENLNLVTSYAGFSSDEDSILYELYKKGIDQQEGREENDPEFLFRWFSEELYEQVPWVTQKYLTQQRNRLRPNTFKRLFRNEWTAGSETFVDSEVLTACTHPDMKKGFASNWQVCCGVDIGIKHDTSAIVLVGKINKDTLAVINHKCFVPMRGQTLDLEKTVEAQMLAFNRKYNIKSCFYDPYQFARSAKTLEKAGIKMQEYPQTTGNTVAMSETLSGLLNNQSLMLYADKELRQHLLNAEAKETPRGWRLVKRKASKKIDLAIALAMACQAAQETFLLKSTAKGKVYIGGGDYPFSFLDEGYVPVTKENRGKGRVMIM